MEKHKCKLCFRNFANGRALGGHMRSHMMNLPKPNESPPAVQLSFEAESSSSFENDVVDKGGGGLSLSYGLRENPKRSFRFVDPEFLDAGLVILQDRESETESSRNPTRRRSRNYESASSASDTTTEEDVAFCLMMLSRDRWKRQRQHHELMMEEEQEEEEEEQYEEEEEEEEEEDSEDDESEEEEEEEEVKPCKANTRVRGGRYKCDTCNKVFRSYQALGGHRASHKKIKVVVEEPEPEHENNNNNNGDQGGSSVVPEKKIHECPVCFRVFASGQALGGHKRTHVIGSTATATATATVTIAAATNATTEARSSAKLGDSTLIDLNLPAPMDDDDASQIEDSAVSDAEFVKSR